ncbi:nicotinate phosphoribosyltransferase [Caballeronia sp. AZ1_KS37]|uniref:nicotinate phosphoribosyltransferase n=1 Tax=Caballeronia sp. AZ1_KS37 TaxID=2921756 RepID=UPI0020277CD7|nr:nicotinate phosphoribosyltransferase [Caballeronia sp. AZ1_KS37]
MNTLNDPVLLTDLYELTMLQAYFDCGMNETATFELFVRSLPAQRNFLMAAGLDPVLDYLSDLEFNPVVLGLLKRTGRFSDPFLHSLESLRFTGSVHALPEGSVFFANEPVLRITAPLREAQLVESRVMNLIHYSTLAATKAARCTLAARGKSLIDFGLRRAHGSEAAMLSARSSYIAGFDGTATLLAGLRYEIPVFGTMAHSYVQAHDSEREAFAAFMRSQPDNATLLIDTYDTERAARIVVELAGHLAADGLAIRGVRLDSGDLAEHARRVRRILDEGGLAETAILASGNLDEWRLRDLVRSDVPIDSFGVGTRMNTSADAPYLDCAYKLTQYAGRPRRKRSEGKATLPGVKQIFRRYDAAGTIRSDVIALEEEPCSEMPLLQPVMRYGLRVRPTLSLSEVRQHARREMASLPERLQELDPADPLRVETSATISELARRLDHDREFMRDDRGLAQDRKTFE